jgi:hypothetical protein
MMIVKVPAPGAAVTATASTGSIISRAWKKSRLK